MMLDLLSYGFMQRAIIGGTLVAFICALIGTFLVLKRLSLIGDALAHVSFGGIAVGLLLGVEPLFSALVVTLLGSFGVQKLIDKTKVYGESATAIVLSLGMAVAITIIGAVKGFNVNLFSYLFGSILTISQSELFLIGIIFLVILGFVVFFYKKLMFVTFNEEVARVSGINVKFVNNVLSVLTALAIVTTIKTVGILLTSALIVIPAITALQLATSFKKTLFFAILISLFSIILGIISGFYLDLPVGGIVVIIMCGLFLLSLLFTRIRRK